MNLTDKRLVVIGGTSGIGLATAKAAAEAGAEVVIVSGRSSSVERALAELPGKATGHAVDVLDAAAVDSMFAQIGTFDHLAYTAGEPLALAPVADLDLDTARAFFQTRYFGALVAVRAAAPRLNAGGSITRTGGSASERPAAGWAVPASLCGAMEALTRALAVELAPIRVNLVRPGVVRSPLWSGMTEGDRQGLFAERAAALPVGHVGEVEEIAQAYVYCMTQTYSTGAVVSVDGGALLV